MKRTITFILSLSVFWLYAQSTTISLNKYNTIYEAGNLSNGMGDHLFAGRTNQSAGMNLRRALLQFDLSTIPAGATITGVTLNLDLNQTISGAIGVSLHKLTQDWGQGISDAAGQEGAGATSTVNDASWNCSFHDGASGCTTSWTTAGGDFNTTASATTSVDGNGAYTWTSATMLTDVQGWFANSATNFGWMLIGDETTDGTAKRFSANTTNPPTLELTYNTLSSSESDFTKVIVTPNPTTGDTNIQLGSPHNTITVTITNSLGQTVSTFTEQTETKALTIPLTGQPTGLYFVTLISSKGEKVVVKIIKA
ncbi:DNRLRE domain-containing protein [Tamlana sp. 2201CG12-4]|uniref:DNRLRE domain-containing protein n=1 Tax=Tamlana sp. 2201CG12-4 TaxID=3112582 RepID=UPI002DB87A94|nr:DNRLRE domain-containing protein [Tamlana sp. 2201CG12-4]MEC3908112.1 DNRLRE domain-containing protein [Tamlana sp. 2201CG12-4]